MEFTLINSTTENTLIIGVVALIGIAAVLTVLDKLKSILGKTFVTQEDCNNRMRCQGTVLQTSIESIKNTQIKQNVVLSMIANSLSIEGVEGVDLTKN